MNRQVGCLGIALFLGGTENNCIAVLLLNVFWIWLTDNWSHLALSGLSLMISSVWLVITWRSRPSTKLAGQMVFLDGPCCNIQWAHIFCSRLFNNIRLHPCLNHSCWSHCLVLLQFRWFPFLHTVNRKTLHSTIHVVATALVSSCAMEVQVTTLAGDCLTFRCKRWTLRDLKDGDCPRIEISCWYSNNKPPA